MHSFFVLIIAHHSWFIIYSYPAQASDAFNTMTEKVKSTVDDFNTAKEEGRKANEIIPSPLRPLKAEKRRAEDGDGVTTIFLVRDWVA